MCLEPPGLKYPRGEELRMSQRGRRWWWKRSGAARKLGVRIERENEPSERKKEMEIKW